jgi:hypothetical protein
MVKGNGFYRDRLVRLLGWSGAAAIAACVCCGIAGAQTWTDQWTDKGALRLQLGAAATTTDAIQKPPRFVYETPGRPKVGEAVVQWTDQALVLTGKCSAALATASDGSVPELAALKSGPYGLGMGLTSIGVNNGPKGVDCYRISQIGPEWVQFELGSHLKTLGARSFYRVSLDIEVKQNAKFKLEVLRGTATQSTWYLESGSSIGTTTAEHVFPCKAKADSGPDSGALDNCRWNVDELGDGFRLTALVGEGSLEGGGDFGAEAYFYNTVLYLTDAEVGVLGCLRPSGADAKTTTSTIGDGVNTAQCAVTRVDPTGYGGSCQTNIGYLFRTVSTGVGGCELAKSEGEQVAAVLDVFFPPEPRAELNSTDLTEIKFPVPGSSPETYVSFPIPRCRGTLKEDANGNPTIEEVLNLPTPHWDPLDPTKSIDVIPGGKIEWACVLEQEEDYWDKSTAGAEQMRVRQKILFWGDPIIIRQAGQ